MKIAEYVKGSEEAQRVYGIKQAEGPCATPKPPPTWAHGKKVTIPSMTERPAK